MSRFTISILLVFGLLQLNYSQNKMQQIKPGDEVTLVCETCIC